MIQSLERTELLALLAAARAGRERDWLMLLVGFCHGLRASEVVGIRADDVRDGYISVKRLKGSLHTVQPLLRSSDPLLSEDPALVEYAAKVAPDQKLFPVTRQHFWRLFQRYGQIVGLAKHLRHPHILKHTIAMQTIESAGIENVRQYLGHKNISSTGAYLKVSDAAASKVIGDSLEGLKS